MTRRGRTGADRGAAAVEMALVLPLLLVLVFGIIDFGRMLNAQIRLTEAAREAARADVLGEDVADAQSRFNDAFGTGGSIAPDTSCSDDAKDAKYTASYEFEFVTPVGVLAGFLPSGSAGGEVTLEATGVMPCRA